MFKYNGKVHMIVKKEMPGRVKGIRVENKECVYIGVNSLLPKHIQQKVTHDLLKNRNLKAVISYEKQ